MDINSRNLGQQEEDLDKKKFRKRASMSRPCLQSLGPGQVIRKWVQGGGGAQGAGMGTLNTEYYK